MTILPIDFSPVGLEQECQIIYFGGLEWKIKIQGEYAGQNTVWKFSSLLQLT